MTGSTAGFPARRMRRLRRTPALRRLVAETRLGVDDLVAPLFVREGTAAPVPIPSMPGQVQHSVDSLVVEAKHLVSLGIPALILFGVGTGPVRGFAITLCIGLVSSVFTAFVVTRTVYDYLLSRRRLQTVSI